MSYNRTTVFEALNVDQKAAIALLTLDQKNALLDGIISVVNDAAAVARDAAIVEKTMGDNDLIAYKASNYVTQAMQVKHLLAEADRYVAGPTFKADEAATIAAFPTDLDRTYYSQLVHNINKAIIVKRHVALEAAAAAAAAAAGGDASGIVSFRISGMGLKSECDLPFEYVSGEGLFSVLLGSTAVSQMRDMIEPNSTITLSPGKGTDMQAQDAHWADWDKVYNDCSAGKQDFMTCWNLYWGNMETNSV
jgi:hypothetical protein